MVSTSWWQSWNCLGRGVNSTYIFAVEKRDWPSLDLPYGSAFFICFFAFRSFAALRCVKISFYFLGIRHFHVEKSYWLQPDIALETIIVVRRKCAILPLRDAFWQKPTRRMKNAFVWALAGLRQPVPTPACFTLPISTYRQNAFTENQGRRYKNLSAVVSDVEWGMWGSQCEVWEGRHNRANINPRPVGGGGGDILTTPPGWAYPLHILFHPV